MMKRIALFLALLLASPAFADGIINGGGGSPTGTAGGDLSGTYPNPTVSKVNGNTPGGSCAAGSIFTSSNSSGVPTCTAPARSQSTPANKAITASSSSAMFGLAGSVTPAISGNVLFMVRADVESSTAGDCTFTIRFGTGTAPTNGAASAGTSAGIQSNPNLTGTTIPLTLIGYATGLVPSTAYWIDVVGGTTASTITCQMFNITVLAIEQ